jgi:type IV secretory pathway TrbF-like protein
MSSSSPAQTLHASAREEDHRPRMHGLPPPSRAQQAVFLHALRMHQSASLIPIRSARNSRIAFLAMFVVACGSLSLNCYQATTAKVIPYIVEVDQQRVARVVGPAAKLSRVPDAQDIQAAVARFVERVRLVSSDPDMTLSALKEAWAYARGPARNQINDYVDATKPFDRAATQRVSAQIVSVIAATSDSWQVDWKETRTDTSGAVIDSALWRGLFRVQVDPKVEKDKDEVFMKNPRGIFVQEFDWKMVPSTAGK